MGTNFRQYPRPGGHELRGEADLADGHATFRLWFTDICEGLPGERPVIVGSALTEITVFLNNALVRDHEFAKRLFAEATAGRQP